MTGGNKPFRMSSWEEERRKHGVDPFYSQFWPNFAGTVFGGIFLTVIFFISKEQLFSLPSLTGTWECEQITSETSHPPFMGMTVWYHVVLLQDKDKITGTGEKDREAASNGNRSYSGQHRIPLEVTGCIEKRLTGPDIVRLHWSEAGTRRTSTTLHELRLSGSKSKGGLFGRFSSTVGASKGTACWTRQS